MSNAANQLIDEKSVGSWVIAVRFAGFPERFLPGQLARHGVVIQNGH